jgi:hypothetical protein
LFFNVIRTFDPDATFTPEALFQTSLSNIPTGLVYVAFETGLMNGSYVEQRCSFDAVQVLRLAYNQIIPPEFVADRIVEYVAHRKIRSTTMIPSIKWLYRTAAVIQAYRDYK